MTTGIATTYRETRFRSRLEAKWAAFFDLVRWSWVYEPFDAGLWIPDFLIQGERPFLVEVGPCVTVHQYYAKAAKPLTYPDLPTLVLGVTPAIELTHDVWGAGVYLGILTSDGTNGDPGAAKLGRCKSCLSVCVTHEWGAFTHFPCGHSSDGHGDEFLDRVTQELWARAGNETQWKA